MLSKRESYIIASSFLLLAGFIGAVVGGSQSPPQYLGGIIVAVFIGSAFSAGFFMFSVDMGFIRQEPSTTDALPTTTVDGSAPVSPDMARQIHDIVNSGNEPALIVEELRRLTEGKS